MDELEKAIENMNSRKEAMGYDKMRDGRENPYVGILELYYVRQQHINAMRQSNSVLAQMCRLTGRLSRNLGSIYRTASR